MATDTTSPMPSSTTGEQQAFNLRAALRAAKGYMLNASIDLETGTPRATTLSTLRGGIELIDVALAGSRPSTANRSPLFDELVKALEAHDAYMLDVGYESPESKALHPKAAENWRRVRELLTRIRSGEQP